MNDSGFSKIEAFIFSGSSSALNFLRVFVIRTAFGDEVFRAYALWLSPALGISEFLNTVVDALRITDYLVPRRLVLGCTAAAFLALVGAIVLNKSAAWVLVFYSMLDGLQFVDVAHRSRRTNWIIQVLRIAGIALIYFHLLAAIAVLTAIQLALASPAAWQSPSANYRQLSPIMSAALGATLASRLRDWLTVYLTQRLLFGNAYFFFYLALRFGANGASLSYVMIRSSLAFDIVTLRQKIHGWLWRRSVLFLSLVTAALAILISVGAWLFIGELILENMLCQIELFGLRGSLRKILAINLTGAVAAGAGILLVPLGGYVHVAAWSLMCFTLLGNMAILLYHSAPSFLPIAVDHAE